VVDRIEDLGLDGLWSQTYPRVSDWLAAAQSRAATKLAFYSGSRLSDQFPDLVKGTMSLSDWSDRFKKVNSS
jgi:hypothetical protein